MRSVFRCCCCLAIATAAFVFPAMAGESLGPWAYGVELEVGCSDYNDNYGCDFDDGAIFLRNPSNTRWWRVKVSNGLFAGEGPTACGVHPVLNCPCACTFCEGDGCIADIPPGGSWQAGCKLPTGYADPCACSQKACTGWPYNFCSDDDDCEIGECVGGTVSGQGCANNGNDCGTDDAFCGQVSADIDVIAVSREGQTWADVVPFTVPIQKRNECEDTCHPNPALSCAICNELGAP